MRVKLAAAGIVAVVSLLLLVCLWGSLVGHNDTSNWQVLQFPSGTIRIVDQPGYYAKWFGKTWTYPRTLRATYGKHNDPKQADQAIRVTFNDGGTADIGAYVMVQLPLDEKRRLMLHQDYSGNPDNVLGAVFSHLSNCVKASGPVMSASENQASRKSEFNQIIEEQLSRGLYKMRRTEIELNDLTEIEEVGVDAAGNKITKEKKARVQATEIVLDKDGKGIIIQTSPLTHYGIEILQFSVTETEYDPQTLEQFAAKKQSYLNAEKSKAQRQEEVQQRLMVEEKGRRQVAEIQASENQEKEKATIQAQKLAEVAVIRKDQAVTEAKQKAEVAEQIRMEALKLKEIAAIESQTAELKKAAAISVAQGKQKEIELGGGLSERDRVLAEIEAKARVGIAEALSKINSPGVVISGSGQGGSNVTENLLNMALLKSTGILKEPVQYTTGK